MKHQRGNMKKIIILAAAAALSACAAASKPGAMVAPVAEKNIIAEDSSLKEVFTVGEVTGGKETNPLWTSEVSNTDFAEALRQTLTAHAMLASTGGTYRIDAEMQKLKQPFAGFNMTVTSTVRYKATDLATNAVVFDEVVEVPYTATTGDAFLGVKRLQLANEGSVKGNMTKFIELLIEKLDAAPTPVASEQTPPQS
jgi:hypothetical protein